MQTDIESCFGSLKYIAGAGVLAVTCGALGIETPKQIYYIDRSAPVTGQDGLSWQHAFRDIQDAINAAKLTPVIGRAEWEYRIAQGEYRPGSGSLDRDSTFNFTPPAGSAISVSLRGSFGGLHSSEPDKQDFVSTRTILSGDLKGDDLPGFTNRDDNAFTVAILYAQAKWAIIEGITFRAGNSIGGPEAGGWGNASGLIVAVWRDEAGTSEWSDGELAIQNCRIEENLADRSYGGGMQAAANFMFVSDSQFISNSAMRGTGGGAWMSMDGGTWPTFFGCLFESNSAAYGGGLFVDTGGATVIVSTFAANSAAVQGGAIFGGASLDGSLLLQNHAGSSGGAIAYSGVWGFQSRFSTIAENSSPVAPAISVYSGSLQIDNTIIWGNTGSSFDTPPVRIVDSIRGCSVSNSLLNFGRNGIEVVNSEAAFMGTISDFDPLFIRPSAAAASSAWRDWNYRLRLESPAIGIGGDDHGWDLDGNNWWGGDSTPPDAGCYRVSGQSCPADLTSNWDRIVDDADFVEFIAAYELDISPPANPNADFNRDGFVNDADFVIFAAAYDQLVCP